MNIPLGIPICLKAHTGNNLQNEYHWRRGKCDNKNTLAFEQMILLKTDDGKIIIQSRWNKRNLQVKPSGECVFATHNKMLWEKFDVESGKNGEVYFISCHTGKVMQCNEHGFAWCANENRLEWEAWRIVYPKSIDMMTSGQLMTISLAATGLIMFPVVGLAAGALVPLAMASFGTVVAGVGSFHAPLAAGGCAAILQASSAALLTGQAAAAGAATGAAIGFVSNAINKAK
jgi:hypothetical protein